MFLVAVPIAALAFLASWLIPQVELKRWPEADAEVPGAELPGAEVPGAAVPGAGMPGADMPPQETLDPQDAGRIDP